MPLPPKPELQSLTLPQHANYSPELHAFGTATYYISTHAFGHGGDGTLYFAKEAATDKIRVLKKSFSSPQFEAQILQQLNHPHIMRVLAVSSLGDMFVMEWMPHGNLRSYVKSTGVLSDVQCFEVLLSLSSALTYLHAKLIIHRDVKPENVLINAGGQVKLADFGCAKKMTASHEKLSDAAGTINHCAPEMMLLNSYDQSADMWSLGVLLFYCVTKTLPFDEPTLRLYHESRGQKGNGFRSVISPDRLVERVTRNLLAVAPEQRYTAEQATTFASNALRRAHR